MIGKDCLWTRCLRVHHFDAKDVLIIVALIHANILGRNLRSMLLYLKVLNALESMCNKY